MKEMRAEDIQRQMLRKRGTNLPKKTESPITERSKRVKSTARKSTHATKTIAKEVIADPKNKKSPTTSPAETTKSFVCLKKLKESPPVIASNGYKRTLECTSELEKSVLSDKQPATFAELNSPKSSTLVKALQQTVKEIKGSLRQFLRVQKTTLDSETNCSPNTSDVSNELRRAENSSLNSTNSELKSCENSIEIDSIVSTSIDADTCFRPNEPEGGINEDTKSIATSEILGELSDNEKSFAHSDQEDRDFLERDVGSQDSPLLASVSTSDSYTVVSEGCTVSEDAGSEEGLKLWLDLDDSSQEFSTGTGPGSIDDSAEENNVTESAIQSRSRSPIDLTSNIPNSQEQLPAINGWLESSNEISSPPMEGDSELPQRDRNSISLSETDMSVLMKRKPVISLERLPKNIVDQIESMGSVQIIQLGTGNAEMDFFTISNYLHPCRPRKSVRKRGRKKQVTKTPEILVIDGIEFYSFETEAALNDFTIQDQITKLALGVPVFGSDVNDADACGYVKPIIPTKTDDITKIKGWRNKIFASETTAEKEVVDLAEMKKFHWLKRLQMNSGLLELMKRRRMQLDVNKVLKKKTKLNLLMENKEQIVHENTAKDDENLMNDSDYMSDNIAHRLRPRKIAVYSDPIDELLENHSDDCKQDENEPENDKANEVDEAVGLTEISETIFFKPQIVRSLVHPVAKAFKTKFGWFQKFGSAFVPVGSACDLTPTFSPLKPTYKYKQGSIPVEEYYYEKPTLSLAEKGLITPKWAEFAVSAVVLEAQRKATSLPRETPELSKDVSYRIADEAVESPVIVPEPAVAPDSVQLEDDERSNMQDDQPDYEKDSSYRQESEEATLPECGRVFCKFGCLCDSLKVRKRKRSHCGKSDCMFVCHCGFTIHSKGDNGTRVTSAALTQMHSESVNNNEGVVKRRRISRPPARLMDYDVSCKSQKDLPSLPELVRERIRLDIIAQTRIRGTKKGKALKPKNQSPANCGHAAAAMEPKVPPIRITNLKGNAFPKVAATTQSVFTKTTVNSRQIQKSAQKQLPESQHILPCGTTFVQGCMELDVPKETDARTLISMGEIVPGRSSLRFIGLRMNNNPNMIHTKDPRSKNKKGSVSDSNDNNALMTEPNEIKMTKNYSKFSAFEIPKAMPVKSSDFAKIIGYVMTKQNLRDAVSLTKLTKSPVSAPVALAVADFVPFEPRNPGNPTTPCFNIYPVNSSQDHVFVGPFDKILPEVFKNYVKKQHDNLRNREANNEKQIRMDVSDLLTNLKDRICENEKEGIRRNVRISAIKKCKMTRRDFTQVVIKGNTIRKKTGEFLHRTNENGHVETEEKGRHSQSNIFDKFAELKASKMKIIRHKVKQRLVPQLLSAEVAPLAWKKNVELHREQERLRRQDLLRHLKRLSIILDPTTERTFHWNFKWPSKIYILKEAQNCIRELEAYGKSMERIKRSLINRRHSLFQQYIQLVKELPNENQKAAIRKLTLRLQKCCQARADREKVQTNWDPDAFIANETRVRKVQARRNEDDKSSESSKRSTSDSDDSDVNIPMIEECRNNERIFNQLKAKVNRNTTMVSSQSSSSGSTSSFGYSEPGAHQQDVTGSENHLQQFHAEELMANQIAMQNDSAKGRHSPDLSGSPKMYTAPDEEKEETPDLYMYVEVGSPNEIEQETVNDNEQEAANENQWLLTDHCNYTSKRTSEETKVVGTCSPPDDNATCDDQSLMENNWYEEPQMDIIDSGNALNQFDAAYCGLQVTIGDDDTQSSIEKMGADIPISSQETISTMDEADRPYDTWLTPQDDVIEECFEVVVLPSEETSVDSPTEELPKIIACSTISEAEFMADS